MRPTKIGVADGKVNRAAELAMESREPGPSVEIVPIPTSGPFGEASSDVEVLLHWGLSLERFQQCARVLGGVRWIHTFWAGTERIVPIAREFSGPPRFTDSRGVYSVPMAEHVLGVVLGLLRGLHVHRDAQRERRWSPFTATELHGKRVLIIGAGGIGGRSGELLGALGAEVVGIRRRATDQGPFPVQALEDLDQLLPTAEIVICALPETPETIGLLSGTRLSRLPRGARLVNVGRGTLIDEPALVAAIRAGRVAGAALDVFAEEPLPADSPLWDRPEVWITPHCSGLSPEMDRRRLDLFRSQLASYRRGESLANEIDLAAGGDGTGERA